MTNMMNQNGYNDFIDEMDLELEFDVEPSQGTATQQTCASGPIYVKSRGRGKRPMLNPLDIPLPWQYYEEMEKVKRKAAAESKSSTPGITALYPARISHRGRASNARPRIPREQGSSHTMKNSRVPGRGRGRMLEEGVVALQQKNLPVVNIRDLGKGGFPSDTANMEEGKARLMQMFLDQESVFDRESSDSSAHSAPNFSLKNEEDFPRLITEGVPFKRRGGGSHPDGSLKKVQSRSRDLASSQGESTGRMSSSNRVERASSSADTAERCGKQLSGEEGLLDSEGGDMDEGLKNINRPLENGVIPEPKINTFLSSNSQEVMGGPNVLELMNLPPSLTHVELGDLLMGCGVIVEMRILRDPDTGQGIGLAYVRMENEDACLMAVSSYHNVESPFLEMYGEEEIPKLIVRHHRS